MNRLQLRKQTLILESELNRLTLRGECRNLRSVTAQFRQTGRNMNWVLALAPVAGILAVRLFSRRESPTSRVLSAGKWLWSLYSLWRGFKAASAKK